MIYGGEYDRPDSGRWVIEMLDDDAYGLDILFSIIHYKFYEIPDRPDVSQLYKIALVADKYDCTHLLVPWMKNWVTGLNWHIVMANGQTDDDKILYLTWVFGEGRWFSRIIAKVAHKATISADGDLLDSHGEKWDIQRIPADILGWLYVPWMFTASTLTLNIQRRSPNFVTRYLPVSYQL
jgi:hypothetical protein